MDSTTCDARALREAETAALIAELEAALKAYGRSIDRGLALAAEMRQLADTIELEHGNAVAELQEWL